MKLRFILLITSLALVACDPPGRPKPSAKWEAPHAISDFDTLYRENCLACHSFGATVAASNPMDDPLYLSVLPEEVLRKVVSDGIPGTSMPAFSHEHGGPLSHEQVEIIVKGILAKRPATPPVQPLPPYSAALGDVSSGGRTFASYCASCHGATGTGASAGSVVKPAYLDLVSDQYLRTITIAGRPDLGCPDFSKRVPGRLMSDSEIADVVAWLASQRKDEFGQPVTPKQ